jgi:hypothetical protein
MLIQLQRQAVSFGSEGERVRFIDAKMEKAQAKSTLSSNTLCDNYGCLCFLNTVILQKSYRQICAEHVAVSCTSTGEPIKIVANASPRLSSRSMFTQSEVAAQTGLDTLTELFIKATCSTIHFLPRGLASISRLISSFNSSSLAVSSILRVNVMNAMLPRRSSSRFKAMVDHVAVNIFRPNPYVEGIGSATVFPYFMSSWSRLLSWTWRTVQLVTNMPRMKERRKAASPR